MIFDWARCGMMWHLIHESMAEAFGNPTNPNGVDGGTCS
jgi:hypothetical protein